MGTLSGDGYYQQVDEDRYGEDHFGPPVLSTPSRVIQVDPPEVMQDRFFDADAAAVGEKINCATCGKVVLKKHYQQKFCPPIKRGKRKSYRCKDRYHNVTNPRGLMG